MDALNLNGRLLSSIPKQSDGADSKIILVKYKRVEPTRLYLTKTVSINHVINFINS
jgi:hypothetical protein